MSTRTIEITDVKDLQPGDIATFKMNGHEYTGPVWENEIGEILWATYVLRNSSGRVITTGLTRFVKATRGLPVLPTAPLSVITDVVINGNHKYPLAVRQDDEFHEWVVINSAGGYADEYPADAITSFKLAKVVEA